MYKVDLYAKVRRAVMVENQSERATAKRFGISRKTVSKMLRHTVPPGYQRKDPPVSPKLGPFVGIVNQILLDDRDVLKKQRHTAVRIFERLRDEHGYQGGYTVVREFVAKERLRQQEVFIPLAHPPGRAQVDFGEADIYLGGVKTRIHYFCLDLPHSDAIFVKAYPAETTEAFLDGHVTAFAWLGGVPQSVLYDNTKIAVAKILGDGRRTRTKSFGELQSHYLFEDRFGRPAKGNDKGKVEGLVGYIRRNFMVPLPRVRTIDELNARLLNACEKRKVAVLRGKKERISDRLNRDRQALMPLPTDLFDPCEKVSTHVSSLSLVRYRSNDYSVPTAYGYHDVLVRGYVDSVVIACGSEVIARHPRCYAKEEFIYNPLHYLALLERKPNALDQAAPLQKWNLPEEFEHLRRLLEGRMGKKGRKEYIQVLRLMETFGDVEVAVAVEEALRLSAISYDAVMERRFPFTPRVQPGEAPLSVLRRGALGNGHKSTMRYAYSVNPSLDYTANTLGALARNPQTYFETCEGIGLSRDEVEAISYDRIGCGRLDDVLWMGLTVRQDCLRFRRSKICLACYLERGYAPANWDHVASSACSKHRILLDDACPCCGVPWTPDRDPFGCGCDRETMVALQQTCSDRAAMLMDHVIDVQDQNGLTMLGHFWHLSEYWRAIGLTLSKVDVAEALADLITCDWPILPSQRVGHALHPRVALAPLLATRDRRCRVFAQNLLTKRMPANHAPQLDDVLWPATIVQAVLGIGRVPFFKLINDQHIVPTADGRFCAAAINDLLSYIASGSKSQEVVLPIPSLRSGNRQKSLAKLIGMIKSQDIAAYSCPPQGGLANLRCVPQHSPPPKAFDGISRREAAIRLGTNVESVRLAIKLKLLQATKGSPWSAVQWAICERSLEEFEAKYVFASAIARRHGAAVTTVSSRLRSAGLQPISGPGIDGGGSFLFMRDDVERIDLHLVLTQPYQSPAGRKRRADSELSMPVGLLSSKKVAEELGASVRQLRDIVQQGWIEPVAIISQRRAFSPEAVHTLQHRLRKDYVPLVDAAQILGQTKAQFQKTWTSTGVMRCHHFSRRLLIQRVDLERAELIWRDLGSSSSIAATLNRDFWLCHALEKIGRLTAVETLGYGSKSVRLYKRDAPMLDNYRISAPQR